MNLYSFWLGPEGWKALWVALRRAPRDAHARIQVIRLFSSLLLLGGLFTLYAFYFHGMTTEFGKEGRTLVVAFAAGVFILLCGLGIYFWLEKRHQDRTNPDLPEELKRALFHEAVLLATLLERLGSEVAMEKELPPEVTIITRRVLLDRLEHHQLRQDLEPWLLDVLLAPDGHWTTVQKERAVGAWECFAVMNWVLGLGELRGLTMEPVYQVNGAQALAAIERPDKLRVLPSWDLRPARDAALKFLNRCWAELLARNVVSGAADEDIARAMEMSSAIKEKGYTGDYLVGARTISELETPLLFALARRAWSRWELLSLLVPIAAGETPPSQLRVFFSQYFATREAPQDDHANEPA